MYLASAGPIDAAGPRRPARRRPPRADRRRAPGVRDRRASRVRATAADRPAHPGLAAAPRDRRARPAARARRGAGRHVGGVRRGRRDRRLDRGPGRVPGGSVRRGGRRPRARSGPHPLLVLTLGEQGYLLDDPAADQVVASVPRRVVEGVPMVGAGDTFGAAPRDPAGPRCHAGGRGSGRHRRASSGCSRAAEA